MNDVFQNAFKWIMAALGAVAGLFGEWNAALTCLLILNAIDYATGVVCAIRGKSVKTETGGVSSKAGFDGLARKAFIWLVILLTAQLDKVIGDSSAFRMAACFYYIANEGISILENVALMGVPVPPFISKILESLRDKSGEAGTSATNVFTTTVSDSPSVAANETPYMIGKAMATAKEAEGARADHETDDSNEETTEEDPDPL